MTLYALNPWHTFTHPHVRNLAWVIASPSLLSYLPNTDYAVDVLGDDFGSNIIWPICQNYSY